MFTIKVLYNHGSIGKTDYRMFQAQGYMVTHEPGAAVLWLSGFDDETVRLERGQTVFVMNESGKTVDRIDVPFQGEPDGSSTPYTDGKPHPNQIAGAVIGAPGAQKTAR